MSEAQSTNGANKITADVKFIRYLKEHGGDTMKKCYQCATCSVACELSPKEYAFPRKEMIQASWGQKEKLISDPDVWLCHGCQDCSLQCPRNARPADLMGAVRSYVYRAFAVPKFLGDALSRPKALPGLFLGAMAVVLIMIFATNMVYRDGDMNFFIVNHGQMSEAEFLAAGGEFNNETEQHHFHKKDGIMEYDWFKSHGGNMAKAEFLHSHGIVQYHNLVGKPVIQVMFFTLNIIVFILAYIGLRNYWNAMAKDNPYKQKQGFWKSAIDVFIDFLAHRKFDKCPTNSARRWGHLYVFYGFFGTAIATGIVVLGEMYEFGVLNFEIFHLPYPMGLFHPVKILGMISGIFLVIGFVLLYIKRIQTEKEKGRSTYNDWLFLWILGCVAISGVLTVLVRMPYSGEAQSWLYISYAVYFIHLVLVTFLLVYMPWSKFAHMVYRYTGLVYLKSRGRENKPEVFSKN